MSKEFGECIVHTLARAVKAGLLLAIFDPEIRASTRIYRAAYVVKYFRNAKTITPVTETYSQIGKVHRAMRRWTRN